MHSNAVESRRQQSNAVDDLLQHSKVGDGTVIKNLALTDFGSTQTDAVHRGRSRSHTIECR